MNSEADFIAAIAASPGDELLYGAFADWLEERGDERAAWVRSPRVRLWMGERFTNPVPPIIAALKAKRHVLDARRAMPDIGAAAVPDLVALLDDDSSIVRLQAVWCLRKIGPPAVEAVPALFAAMKDVSPDVRIQAANAIEDITKKGGPAKSGQEGVEPSEGVLAQLLRWLASEDADERLLAVNGLAKLRRDDCVAPLCCALADEAQNVREASAYHLIWFARRDAVETVWALRQALADTSARVRVDAAVSLGIIGKRASAAVPELLRLLGDDAPVLRVHAALALGSIAAGDEEVVQALHRATQDANADVARAAAEAMGRWPCLPADSGEVVLALIRRLREGDFRGYAGDVARVLGKLERPTPAVLACLRDLLNPGEDMPIDGPASALGEFGSAAAEAIPDLVTAARDTDATSAALALARMGEAGVAALLQLLEDPAAFVQDAALMALCRASGGAAVVLPRLLEIIRQPGHPRRWFAVSGIRRLGSAAAEAAPDLIAILPDGEHWGCGAEAYKSLEAFGAALLPHVPSLAALCDSDGPARLRAVRLLAMLAKHSPDVLDPLRRALRAVAKGGPDSARVRRYAAEGLGRLGTDALPDLESLLHDADAAVRRHASAAIQKIQAKRNR